MIGLLDVKSFYSLLDSTLDIETLVAEAKLRNYDAIALTDTYLHGIESFIEASLKQHIKPIVGVTVWVEGEFETSEVIIYAKCDEGLQDLYQLSRMHDEKETITWAYIQPLLDRCHIVYRNGANLLKLIKRENEEAIYRELKTFLSWCPKGYLGISLDTYDEEMILAKTLIHMADQLHIPIIPVTQTRYLTKEDKDLFQMVQKIKQSQNTLEESADYHMLTQDEYYARFLEYQDRFEVHNDFIQSFDLKYPKKVFSMPSFVEETIDPSEYLMSLSHKGLDRRLSLNKTENKEVYYKRLSYELSVIKDMGYDNYFLIVFDFVRYAKQKGIMVGPGRGSAAGSLVSYCLGITDIDPITYDLLFERFLNPHRKTMPDIDMDFPDDKRDEVIEYVGNKYGKHHIASITTFGTFALKSSIRDLAKLMGLPQSRATGIIQTILNDTLDPDDEEAQLLKRYASKLEGIPKYTGTHAAGIVLSKEDLFEAIPLQKGPFSFYQSQLDAKTLEAMGLLKIDFLGIRNLSIIHDVIEDIHKHDPAFKLQAIPLDDFEVFKRLSLADTTGIFQLESEGMRNVLKKLKPKDFEDIVAVLALYRPGPMQFIDMYIERQNGKPFEYLHPDLEPILKKTYGIIVYQEQIMQIATRFAGYTLAEADLLRKAISKKEAHILEAEQAHFIESCLKNGYDERIANTIYAYILKFAHYGFNRSHSVSYAMVAYQMAYLKTHYYESFMSVLLTSIIGNESLTFNYIQELKQRGISVYPPNIQESNDRYKSYKDGIIMPLNAIKGFGKQAVNAIIEKRKQMPFKTFLVTKTALKEVISERQFLSLIYANALDCFSYNQHTLVENSSFKTVGFEQYVIDYQMDVYDEYPLEVLSENERASLGFNLIYVKGFGFKYDKKKYPSEPLSALDKKTSISCVVWIESVKVIKTKKGQQMAFMRVLFEGGSIEVTVFPETYKMYHARIQKDHACYISIFKDPKDHKRYILEKAEGLQS